MFSAPVSESIMSFIVLTVLLNFKTWNLNATAKFTKSRILYLSSESDSNPDQSDRQSPFSSNSDLYLQLLCNVEKPQN